MIQTSARPPAAPAAADPDSASPPPKRYPVQSLATSANGEQLIKAWEGRPGSREPALRTYSDIAGHPTIGWGHRLSRPDEYPDGIDPQRAQELYDADRRRHEDIVRKAVRVPLAQHEFDALVNLAYNIPEAFSRNYKGKGQPTTLLKLLDAGDYDGAAQQFAVWNKAHVGGGFAPVDGLTNRRAAEAAVFRGGPYRGP